MKEISLAYLCMTLAECHTSVHRVDDSKHYKKLYCSCQILE